MSFTILRLLPFIVVWLLPLNHADGFRRIAQGCHHCRWLPSGDNTDDKRVRPVTLVARTAAAAAPVYQSSRCGYHPTAMKHGTKAGIVVVVPTMSPTTAPVMTIASRPTRSPMPMAAVAADMSQLDQDLIYWKSRMITYAVLVVAIAVVAIVAKSSESLGLRGHPPSKNAKQHKPAIHLVRSIWLVPFCLRVWKKTKPDGRWRLIRGIVCSSLGARTTNAITGTPIQWSWIPLIILEQAMVLYLLCIALNGIWREGRRVREELRSETHRRDTAKDLALYGGLLAIFVLVNATSSRTGIDIPNQSFIALLNL